MSDALLAGVVNSLWFGSAAAVALLLLFRALPAIPPRWRYRGWFLLLAVIALLPFTTLRAAGAPDLIVRRARIAPAPEAAAPLPGSPGATIPASIPEGDSGAPEASRTFSLSPELLPILAALWLAGALIGFVILGGELWRLFRLKGHAVRADGPMLDRWLELGHLRNRSARLLVSDDLRLPAACGYVAPAVLLPAEIVDQLDAQTARHLLLHEAAHLDRYDDWFLLVERLLQLLCWWHPVAWLARRQLEATRELACDAAVVASGDRKAYARTLVSLAEMSLPATESVAPGALRGVLSRRVQALLVREPRWSVRQVVLATMGLLLLSLSLARLEPPRLLARRIVSDTAIARHMHAGYASGSAALALDSIFAGYQARGFTGSVLVARGDSILLDKGYGLADRESGISASRSTRYSTAGMTKMFTAAAILLLQHEGRLSVRDTLGRWIDDLPEDMARVTIHQLLTHTDGLTRLSAPVYRGNADDFISAVAATPRAFPAGTSYRYNDFGHSLLGLVVELVSRERYEQFVKRRFLDPAGMRQTTFEAEDQEIAIEYSGTASTLEPIGPRAYAWGRRASLGMVSTTGDLFRWSRAMTDNAILPPDVQQQMRETYGRTDWGADIGYGWDRMKRADGSYLWRRVAGTPGMEGELLYDPVRDWTAVILVNTRLGWRFKVWRDIERRM